MKVSVIIKLKAIIRQSVEPSKLPPREGRLALETPSGGKVSMVRHSPGKRVVGMSSYPERWQWFLGDDHMPLEFRAAFTAENLIEEGPGRYSNHPHTRKLHERHNWSGGGPKPAHKRYGNICRSASAPGCQLRGERFRARANRCCGAGPATGKIMRNFSIAPLKQKWTHRPALVVRLRTGTLLDRVSPPSFHYFFTPPSTVRHSPLRPVRKM